MFTELRRSGQGGPESGQADPLAMRQRVTARIEQVLAPMLALASSLASAEQKQLSITTTSPEALALYQKALDYSENVESVNARPLLDRPLRVELDRDVGAADQRVRDAGAGQTLDHLSPRHLARADPGRSKGAEIRPRQCGSISNRSRSSRVTRHVSRRSPGDDGRAA